VADAALQFLQTSQKQSRLDFAGGFRQIPRHAITDRPKFWRVIASTSSRD
jgi:hypothetical protein